MEELDYRKFQVRKAEINAVQVTDTNRYTIIELFSTEETPLEMRWTADYESWFFWFPTNFGWRKVTEGMWLMNNPELGDGWYPSSDANMQKKYEEIVPPAPEPEPHDIFPPYDR